VILKPTVFILGAGASHPYGYPLGAELVTKIMDLTGPGGGLFHLLKGEENPILAQFHRRLAGSEVDSIDDFLESNTKFATFGKICIAAGLTVWGAPHNHLPVSAYHWYRYLWGRLHQGAPTTKEFRSNRIKVVTYNYDRSFERYLTNVLANTYPDFEEDEKAAGALAAEVVPVVHLHGSLGDAEDAVRLLKDRAQFMNAAFLDHAASGIRIVHEDHPTLEYATAHLWLREAQSVHLLGFGYHPTNLRRLDLLKQAQAAKPGWNPCGGTAFHLEAAEIKRAEDTMKLGNNILHPVDCLMYLRAHATLE
jgi:hypothetical protein